MAHTIRHLGDLYAEQQHHPSPPPLDLANAIRAYASLKSELGETEAAQALWREAGALYQSEGIAAVVGL